MIPIAPIPVFPPSSSNGTRARGRTYERRVADWLRGQAVSLGWIALDHPWLHSAGRLCQPDFLLVSPSECIIIVETKLTECDCTAQLAKYKKALAGHPTTGLQIARRVHSRPTVDCLENTIDNGLMLLWI